MVGVKRMAPQGRRVLVAGAWLVILFLLPLGALPPDSSVASHPPEYEAVESFGPDGTSSTTFDQVTSIAVDQSAGLVYFLDRPTGILHRFAADGTPADWGGSAPYISGNELGGLVLSSSTVGGLDQVAVDAGSHEVYVTSNNMVTAFAANGEEATFTSGPDAGTNTLTGFTELMGVAVDANGTIYAADQGADFVKVYASSGELLTEIAAANPGTLAVNTAGVVYVIERFEDCCGTFPGKVIEYTPSAFPVVPTTTYSAETGTFGTPEPNAVAVDPSSGDVYLTGNGGHPQTDIFKDTGQFFSTIVGFDEPYGVGVHVDTGYVYISNTVCGPGGCPAVIEVFKLKPVPPPEAPKIENLAVGEVGNTSATLGARINPNSAETNYHFEYGLEDCALNDCIDVPTSSVGIGDGHDLVAVSHDIAGLLPSSTYHYRLVAENPKGSDEESGVFRTQGSGLGFELVDERVWEMVSPTNKYGAKITPGLDDGHIQAAADGNGFVYLTGGSIEEHPAGSRQSTERSNALAQRGSGGVWNSKDLTPPNSRVVPVSVGAKNEYKIFSPDLSEALLEPRDGLALSPEASERTPYWRQNSEPPLYRPLVTGKEGFANVPPDVKFGGAAAVSDVNIRAATPGLDHVVLTGVGLASGVPSGATYKWFDGQLEVVSVLPDSEGGGFVPGPGSSHSTPGSGDRSMRHAISDDGARVFWSSWSDGSTPLHLYVRDTVADETARIDIPLGGGDTDSGNPFFEGASADGSAVFFTDSADLTPGASPAGADLYRCELPLSAPLAGCSDLLNISAPLPGSGESAEVLGMVPALSEDGTRAYFVARGRLDTEANLAGDFAVPAQPNLYFWQDGEGVRFIATLSERDNPDWATFPGATFSTEARLSAVGSPNGRHLAFMSERSLTGEGNFDAAWEPVERVFRYDALADRVDCISCHPTGAGPDGAVISSDEEPLIDARVQWEGRLVGSVVPQSPVIGLSSRFTPLHRTRVVHDNGRIYFNAIDGLVPADSNGEWDVYQYEPGGTGTCASSAADADTAVTAGGCLSLISSGTADRPAGFLDASEGGNDVFFLTSAPLSALDQDKENDVYDARVDGIKQTLEPPAECLGEACQPPPVVPNDPTPAGNTFQGPGNLKPKPPKRCPKGKRKVKRQGKVRCVPRKNRKSQDRKPRAGQDRRAAR